MVLRVVAGVDVLSDTATWLLTAIDPDTGLPATDAERGLLLPSYNPNINLGTLPTAPEIIDVPIPPAEPSTQPVTNSLFIQAQNMIPAVQSITHRSSFDIVYEPFTASGFAWDVDESGAGIGPLGMAFAPDGETILISGGEGRNSIYRFNLTGGSAITPLSMLDVPIYDMVFDATGRLWVSTGGGPLVQLDPDSGEIIARYGDGVTLGLAVDPDSSDLYVASKNGIEVFDTVDLGFSPYSGTRVNGLAVGADGSLWAATWPYDGQVVRFDRFGQPEVMLELDDEAEGLAFGLAGTPLAGLLFVTHSEGGALTMVDLASMASVEIATGGSRGDFIHVGPDGRVYITQSDQVDVLYPLTPPHIVATTPVDQMELAPAAIPSSTPTPRASNSPDPPIYAGTIQYYRNRLG